MEKRSTARLVTRDGWQGEVALETQRAGMALLEMDTGQKVWTPIDILQEQDDGSYFLPLDIQSMGWQGELEEESGQTVWVVPVLEEDLIVDKHQRETGLVRVHKTVHSQDKIVDEPGFVDEVTVERVTVDRLLDSPISPHYEGDTLVIPLMEEVIVVEKRLMLKEELHVKKQRKEVRQPLKVTLRREEASVERFDSGKHPAG